MIMSDGAIAYPTYRASDLSQDSQVVIYCVHGHAVSQNAAKALGELGFDALYLEGGVVAWSEAGLAVS